MLIGITGQIGAGKSIAADFFRENGACIIDADQIGREVVTKSPALLKKLAHAFGADVLTPKGNLRRVLVAERAFANEQSRQKLNAIVHPYLLKELRKQLKDAKANFEIIVIDAALLLEWNLDWEVDQVLLIHAGEKLRISRLKKRGLSEKDIKARIKAQDKYSAYRKRADIVIFNNGSLAQFKKKLKRNFGKLFSI